MQRRPKAAIERMSPTAPLRP